MTTCPTRDRPHICATAHADSAQERLYARKRPDPQEIRIQTLYGDFKALFGLMYNRLMPERQSIITIQARGHTSRAGYARLDRTLESCAALYNAALQHRRDAWKHSRATVSYHEQCAELTGLRHDDPDWAALSPQVPRAVLRFAHTAYGSFYKRLAADETPGFPRFKPRSRYRTVAIHEDAHLMLRAHRNGYSVQIRGLPTIRIYPSREMPPLQNAISIQITRRDRAIDVNIQFEFTPKTLQPTGRITAFDPTVSQRLTGAEGLATDAISKDRSLAEALQREITAFCNRALADGRASRQPALTRWGAQHHTATGKPRFRLAWTAGYEPLRLRRLKERLSTLQHRERVRTRNIVHAITTELVRNHDVIGLTTAATAQEPDSNVSAERSILEQKLGKLKKQLTYKAEWAGRQLVTVDPRDAATKCSKCGAHNDRPVHNRHYQCQTCEIRLDHDANIVANILHDTQEATAIEHDNRMTLLRHGGPARENRKRHGRTRSRGRARNRGRARSQVARLRVPHDRKTELPPESGSQRLKPACRLRGQQDNASTHESTAKAG